MTATLERHGGHLASGTFHGFIASAISLPAGLVTAAFLTRQLGPVDYGLLTLVGSIIIWVEGTITMGFSRTAVKFMTETREFGPVSTRYMQLQLGVALISAALIASIAPALASLLGASDITRFLRIYALCIPLTALLSVHRAMLIGLGLFTRRAAVEAFYWISRMALVVLFVTIRPSVTGVIAATLVATGGAVMWARRYVRPSLTAASAFPYRPLLAYAWPLFWYQVGMNLFNRLDLFFVKGLSDLPDVAGFYGAAQNLTVVPALFAGSFSPLLLAKLSELKARRLEEEARVLVREALRFVLCLLPFAGMACGAADEVVSAIYGAAFLPAAPFLGLLIFAAVGITLITVISSVFIAAGRPRLPLLLVGPLVLAAPGLHYLFISRVGPLGAAWVTTGLAWLCAAAALARVYTLFRVRPSLATVTRSIAVSFLAFFCTDAWSATGAVLFLELSAVSLLIVAAFILTGEIKRRDIAFARSVFRRDGEGGGGGNKQP